LEHNSHRPGPDSTDPEKIPMLMDIVGIVIAFAVVMLLLSLMVTTLGQATQAALRLRGRNLQTGLAVILDPELRGRPQSRSLAAEVLNDDEIASINKVPDPHSARARLRGPAVSWVEPETLRTVLARISEAEAGSVDSVVHRFELLDKPLSKRFAFTMRMVAIFWALVIAVLFQISAPALIRQLSTDPALREQYAAIATDVLQFTEDTQRMIEEYQPIFDNALGIMAERHPELADEFSAVNTATPNLGDVSEELSDIIDGAEDQDRILAELEDIMYADVRRHRDEMLKRAVEAQRYLSLIDITPYRYGNNFYYYQGVIQYANILGVLMTMILIMLGGQFWYNTLKTALSFRDLLAPSADERKANAPSGGNP
jgi:hypothetical protein